MSQPSTLTNLNLANQEKALLTTADIPIATVSATTKQLLSVTFDQPFASNEEVVFSRAHYSMALACLLEAYSQGKSAWLVDPTNYIEGADWNKVLFTEKVAQLVARHELLKDLKNIVDTRARNKLPISDALEGPLLALFEKVKRPILSLHYEAGNKLVTAGHRVVQVVTDPHVRPQYLDPLPQRNEEVSSYPVNQLTNRSLIYCVFDAPTKQELLNLAKELGKSVNPDSVIVTGPPVDPRIINDANDVTLTSIPQYLNTSTPLRLAITTGGVGTNFGEIKALLSQIKPEHLQGSKPLQLILYAGLHKDFANLYRQFSQRLGIPLSDIHTDTAPLRLIHTDSLVEANELLIDHVFPWADAIITKPSGDMAYDAAAARIGCLFLDPLGPWEENIQERFVALGIGHDLDVNHLVQELDHLLKNQGDYPDFFTAASNVCAQLPNLYTHGCENIIDVVVNW